MKNDSYEDRITVAILLAGASLGVFLGLTLKAERDVQECAQETLAQDPYLGVRTARFLCREGLVP